MAPLIAGQMPVVVVSGGEFAVLSHDRRHARSKRTVLLPPSLPISLLLCSRLRCSVNGALSVFVSGDAYANPATVLFLSLKNAVLPTGATGGLYTWT